MNGEILSRICSLCHEVIFHRSSRVQGKSSSPSSYFAAIPCSGSRTSRPHTERVARASRHASQAASSSMSALGICCMSGAGCTRSFLAAASGEKPPGRPVSPGEPARAGRGDRLPRGVAASRPGPFALAAGHLPDLPRAQSRSSSAAPNSCPSRCRRRCAALPDLGGGFVLVPSQRPAGTSDHARAYAGRRARCAPAMVAARSRRSGARSNQWSSSTSTRSPTTPEAGLGGHRGEGRLLPRAAPRGADARGEPSQAPPGARAITSRCTSNAASVSRASSSPAGTSWYPSAWSNRTWAEVA